jgi:hypothetical protein
VSSLSDPDGKISLHDLNTAYEDLVCRVNDAAIELSKIETSPALLTLRNASPNLTRIICRDIRRAVTNPVEEHHRIYGKENSRHLLTFVTESAQVCHNALILLSKIFSSPSLIYQFIRQYKSPPLFFTGLTSTQKKTFARSFALRFLYYSNRDCHHISLNEH